MLFRVSLMRILVLLSLIALVHNLGAQPCFDKLKTISKDSLDDCVREQLERFMQSESNPDSMMTAGVLVYGRGEIGYARKFFEMAYEIHKKKGDRQGMSRSNNNIAVMYELDGRFAEALDCYFKSLNITEELKDSMPYYEYLRVRSSLYNNLGVLYNETKEYDKGMPYFLKSMQYSYQLLDYCAEHYDMSERSELIEKANNSLAYGFLDMAYNWQHRPQHNFDSALYYYQKSYQLLVENNSEYQYHAQANIGFIYFKKGNTNKAIKMLEEAYRLAQKNNCEISLSPIYRNLSHVYMQTKDYKQAHKFIHEGIEYSSKNRCFADKVIMVKKLFELQLREGNYEQAEVTNGYLTRLSDSLLNKEKKEVIAKLEVVYDTERKEYEAKLAQEQLNRKEAQLSRERIIFLLIAVFMLLTALLITFLIWKAHIKERYKKAELENRLFRSQINPHFMFNALGAIQAYMIDHENKDSIIGYLLNFSALMRNILDASSLETISLDKEIAIISDYLALQHLRFDNSFEYQITLENIEDAELILVPPMLLQPFVENAVVHGMNSIKGERNGLIQVRFARKDSGLHIEVKDNGLGFRDVLKNKTHLSHATNITAERIKAINKLSKYHVEVKVHTEKGVGVSVVLSLKNKAV